MASNGGTLHGVPQAQPGLGGHHNCSHCGLFFESSSSLQVHMHYHHETMNCWAPTSTGSVPSSATSTTPTSDSENNNQPSLKSHIKSTSPHQTIAAAADSSDNQPSTPQPSTIPEPGTPQSFTGGASPYQQPTSIIAPEMHYPTYIHGYDPYYHPATIDYGNPLPPPHITGRTQPEYKAVPSARYHPYNNNNLSNGNHHHQIPPNNEAAPLNSASLSPQVSSSSSTHNATPQAATTVASSTTSTSPQQRTSHIPPTPSPSPIQCEKCGLVCDTEDALNEHDATIHQNQSQQSTAQQTVEPNNMNRSEESDIQSGYSYSNNPQPPPPFVKEEPAQSDILDLDSQKMVYPPEPVLPPMNSLHPLQSMQRHPMMWPHDPHNFMPPHASHELKAPYYHHPIKSEYSPTPTIKSEYQQHAPMHIKTEYASIATPAAIKNEYNLPPSLPSAPTANQSVKPFPEEISENNQMATSPSDFPSTTTPQENNSQFRNFEPPTSSLPNNALPQKGTAWKTNEARRPKTYNCTACNKWFTSSGHLKRHYNTTLHKNAVKSSGQPDPATLPISVHHHPGRDPNYINKGRRGTTAQIQQPIQQPVPPPDPPRSPDYGSQYSASGFTAPQVTSNQGFHQYNSNLQSNSSAVPPNGVAGPSVLASQPRDLQTISNSNMEMLHQQEQMEQMPIITTTTTPTSIPSPLHSQSIINTTEHYHITSPLITNTSIPSFQTILPEAPSYHHIIGNHATQSDTSDMITSDHFFSINGFDASVTVLPSTITPISTEFPRYPGGAEMYQGDTAPPFSPNVPEQYQQTDSLFTELRLQTPQPAATAPSMSPAPCSPRVTSTETNISADSRPAEVHRCDECDKVFNKVCYLTQHNKTFHSGDKPFKCHRCGKRFPCDQTYEEHLAKHGGEKPFKCELCPKQFNHKTDLRRHMCLHSGSKPYACDQCGKGFIRKDHMLKHCETHKKKSSAGAKKILAGKMGMRVNTLKEIMVGDE
ncbi:mucin-2 [Uranotaenia lowii]|uniref:mucin-2 n=1 Tax=Uranotaenia lowii TaxID=190385 RepID=UPI00247AE2C0|nr:mucin-2 [Uranotaenia lowii]